ncbi:MAG TPA: hypothetical protein VFH80_29850 [Solirubrobacteraceae bacterium]|nr:hypothetical protein [Solirubrobacteraceae bacterium]
MRRAYIAAIAAAIIVFLVVSALLARVLSANSAEQSAITSLVTDEARGDANAVIDDIASCRTSAACRTRASYNATTLRHPGAVSIIQIQPSTSFSLADTLGTARVAWNVAGRPHPIVQCVRVHRTGNVISGLKVELLEVSRRIQSDTACPARY